MKPGKVIIVSFSFLFNFVVGESFGSFIMPNVVVPLFVYWLYLKCTSPKSELKSLFIDLLLIFTASLVGWYLGSS